MSEETGGDLFGFWTHSGFPIVQYVIGPGPHARRTASSFYQDREYLVECGDKLRTSHGLQHIGEWHSHHTLPMDHPSQGDKMTVERALESYSLDRFLLLICNLRGDQPVRSKSEISYVQVNGFLFSQSDQLRRCKWVLLPNQSPLRSSREKQIVPSLVPETDVLHYKAEPKTTLDAPLPKYPNFQKNRWIQTDSGKSFLKDLSESIGQCGKIKMFRKQNEDLYLLLKHDECTFVIEIPKEFPKSSIEVKQTSIDPSELKYDFILKQKVNQLMKRVSLLKEKYFYS